MDGVSGRISGQTVRVTGMATGASPTVKLTWPR